MRYPVAAIAAAWSVLSWPVASLAGPPASQTAQPAPTEATPPRISPAAFAKSGGISGLRLSPDGKLVALKGRSNDHNMIAILDAGTRDVVASFTIPAKSQLAWYRWAGSRRLLMSFSSTTPFEGDDVRVTRLITYDLDTRKMSTIARPEMGFEGDDVLYTDPDGQFVLLAIQRTIYDYPSVWRFPLDDTAARRSVLIQPPQHDIWEWYADDSGVVRMGLAFAGRTTRVWYRRADGESFQSIAKLTKDNFDDQIWSVLRIFSGSDEGYALKPDDSGRVALRKFNYATRTPGETVFAVPGWDVTDYDLDKDNKPVVAWYTDDRDKVHWIDPAMATLQAKLERATKGKDVAILSRAKDDSRMVVWVSHEDDPGAYYIYTAAGRSLALFSQIRPEIDPATLAAPKPFSYTARDKTVIHGYLTLPRGRPAKNLPLIILPHGGPYWVRDKLEYDGDVQFLANRGYAVIQPNYRGSDGYGDAFEQLGEGQIGRGMQDDLDDAMDWAVAQGIADPKRVCMIGASYGGYAALWAVIRNPERYRCAVSFAGVTDRKKQLKYNNRFLESGEKGKWRARVTGAQDGFDLDQVSPLAQIGKLTRPVLLTHGDQDTTVPFNQFTALRSAAASAGKPVETLVFPGEGHGFDKPESEQKWYEALDAFLAKNNPAD